MKASLSGMRWINVLGTISVPPHAPRKPEMVIVERNTLEQVLHIAEFSYESMCTAIDKRPSPIVRYYLNNMHRALKP